jgi:hypothetical protein
MLQLDPLFEGGVRIDLTLIHRTRALRDPIDVIVEGLYDHLAIFL